MSDGNDYDYDVEPKQTNYTLQLFCYFLFLVCVMLL